MSDRPRFFSTQMPQHGDAHPLQPVIDQRQRFGHRRLLRMVFTMILSLWGVLFQTVPAQPLATGKDKFLGSSVSSVEGQHIPQGGPGGFPTCCVG
jgi:hypothetical protein